MKTNLSKSCWAAVSLLALLHCGHALGSSEVLWSLGELDGSSIEFAPGAKNAVTFTVNKSQVSRDFPGHQAGSIGFDAVGSGEKPYTIVFNLKDAPISRCQLVADLIYKSGAPQQIKIVVNGHPGIFPVRFAPKKSKDGDEANMMLLAQQRLVATLEPAWLRPGENRISIAPLGIGGLDYDALQLVQTAGAAEVEPHAQLAPTIFFRERNGELMELCDLIVPFHRAFEHGLASVYVGDRLWTNSFSSGPYEFGLWTETIEAPASTRPGPAALQIQLDGESLTANTAFQPAKQWKIFICPKVHNDVGYTDLQPHVNELDNRNTDRALDIMDRFPFYKFNFETAWLVDNYLACRPESYRTRFFNYATSRRATINAFYLNLMTGLCSGEELYRAVYYTYGLAREHGSNFDYACLTDAPSHSWFLPSLLTDVGVKAFSNGSNQTRAPILHFSDLNENSPFYWEGMSGEKIFMWYARSYTQWKRLTGPDFTNPGANYDFLMTSVPQFLTQFLRNDYSPDAVMIYGAYVDNAAIPKTGEAELIERWNKDFAFPKMVVASDAEYFEYIGKNFGDRLPIYRGDAGAYWEDGAASSAAATRLNRLSHEILPAAETACALAALFDSKQLFPAADFEQAWKNVMFYDEHTWGAFNSVSQPDKDFVTRQWEIKESYATRANLDARNLLARGFNRLCQQFAVEGDTLFVFNWQNWARTEPLEIDLDAGRYLIDLVSGQAVPLDVVFEKDGFRRVRFIAENVPPFGYKGYAFRSLGSPALKKNEVVSGPVIETPFYRLTVDLATGGISSLFDKSAGRELADAKADYKLNEYVYVSGGEGSLILNHAFGTPPANLVVRKPGPAKIVENVRTPLGQRLVVMTSATNAPQIRTEYLLYEKIKRIDIANTVEKVETRAKEAIYFAFPFAAAQPAFDYQIQNGWLRPNTDQLPGACREWFVTQNLVRLRDGGFSVAWSTPDAPLFTLTDINRGLWLSFLPIRNGHIFSYAMHNYWFTNYRATQGGRLQFRFSITSGNDLDAVNMARFDAATRTPLLAYPFVSSFSAKVGGEPRPLSPKEGSFFKLDAPELQMVVLKAAEDRDGFILRFREIAGRAGEAAVQSPLLALRDAQLCNGVEVNQKQLSISNREVRVPFKPHQFVTVRLQTADEAVLPKRTAAR